MCKRQHGPLTPLSVEAIVLTTLLRKEPLQRPDPSTWIRDDMNMNHNGKSYRLFLEIVCGWSASLFLCVWILMKSYETDTKPHRAFRSVCSNQRWRYKQKPNKSPPYYFNLQWQKARDLNFLNVPHTHFIHETSREARGGIAKHISGYRHTAIPASLYPAAKINFSKLPFNFTVENINYPPKKGLI